MKRPFYLTEVLIAISLVGAVAVFLEEAPLKTSVQEIETLHGIELQRAWLCTLMDLEDKLLDKVGMPDSKVKETTQLSIFTPRGVITIPYKYSIEKQMKQPEQAHQKYIKIQIKDLGPVPEKKFYRKLGSGHLEKSRRSVAPWIYDYTVMLNEDEASLPLESTDRGHQLLQNQNESHAPRS